MMEHEAKCLRAFKDVLIKTQEQLLRLKHICENTVFEMTLMIVFVVD